MQPINAETVANFTPTYGRYKERVEKTADAIGVDSDRGIKFFLGQVEEINRHSALKLSPEEINILALTLTSDEGNKRFNGSKFIHPDKGGNTGEHQIFISHKIDKVREDAGFGPEHFGELDKSHKIAAADFFRRQHIKGLVHDSGELIDISLSEQQKTGASTKEPPEEALVGPFKIRLAARALMRDDPAFYIRTLHEARERINEKKEALLKDALAGRISGDDFVFGVGKEIGRIITGIEEKLAASPQAKSKLHSPVEYGRATDNLIAVFHSTQTSKDADQAILNMFDKIEGDAHFRHFAGKGKTTPASGTHYMEHAFNHGDAMSFSLASSKEVMDSITYAQKTIPEALKLAASISDKAERNVALKTARAASAELLRNKIKLLQEAMPLIDVSGKENNVAGLSPDGVHQLTELLKRINTGKSMLRTWKEDYVPITKNNRTISEVKGITNTITLITVLDKAASAIASGAYIPKYSDLPIGIGMLPKELQITAEDIKRCSASYPLKVSTDQAWKNGSISLTERSGR